MPATVAIYFTSNHRWSKSILKVPDDVQGFVKLVVQDEPVDVNSMVITFSGWARFEFSRSYFGSTTIFSTAWGVTRQEMVVPIAEVNPLPIGVYIIPFQFKTVFDDGSPFPTSVRERFCTIAYKVKAKLHINRTCRDSFVKAKSYVTLVNLMHFSSLRKYHLTGKHDEMEKVMGCRSGNVKLYAEIPRGGYSPGETIPITVCVSNNSRRYITPKVNLIKTRKLTIRGHGDVMTKSVCSNKIKRAVEPMTEQWSQVMSLKLPTGFHPGTVLNVSSLEITYAVKVSLSIPWEPCDAKVLLPIVIGQ